jgi:hypothetical protein
MINSMPIPKRRTGDAEVTVSYCSQQTGKILIAIDEVRSAIGKIDRRMASHEAWHLGMDENDRRQKSRSDSATKWGMLILAFLAAIIGTATFFLTFGGMR